MEDRVPKYPGRVQLTPVPGQPNKYDMVRADEPTQVGDVLNKANLLPDDVATALGLTGNPQVKDALNKLKTLVDTAQTTANGKAQISTGSYTGTGTCGSGSPNSLVFEKTPLLFVISGRYGNSPLGIIDGGLGICVLANRFDAIRYSNGGWLVAAGQYQDVEFGYNFNTKLVGNTVYWYHNNNADKQFNTSGAVYDVFALI